MIRRARPAAPPAAEALKGPALPWQAYAPAASHTDRIFLGLHSFARHMTDEGAQLQNGLQTAGYTMWGRQYPNAATDVVRILRDASPGVAVIQDKREWDPARPGCFDKEAAFQHVAALQADNRIFKVTVCKDAHHDPEYHAAFAADIGCHAWITYYHPDSICRLAPYLRRQHLLRTWHSINPEFVPPFTDQDRRGCLLSGNATPRYYPLRARLVKNAAYLPLEVRAHPGYHADGSDTNDYLFALSHYKVAICTASRLGYALRKLIEATACGCRVITDLPAYDVLPEIDENLVRISPDIKLHDMAQLINRLAAEYDPAQQEHYAKRACRFYDYRQRGFALAQAIDTMRANYNELPRSNPGATHD